LDNPRTLVLKSHNKITFIIKLSFGKRHIEVCQVGLIRPTAFYVTEVMHEFGVINSKCRLLAYLTSLYNVQNYTASNKMIRWLCTVNMNRLEST